MAFLALINIIFLIAKLIFRFKILIIKLKYSRPANINNINKYIKKVEILVFSLF